MHTPYIPICSMLWGDYAHLIVLGAYLNYSNTCLKSFLLAIKSLSLSLSLMLTVSVVDMCKTFQESVRQLSQRFYAQLRRHNYVTPTSYLELILTFKALLSSRRNQVDTFRNRYLVGLEKLDFAASQVRMIG